MRELYFSLKEQNCWFMTCQTISSEDMVNEVNYQRDCRKSGNLGAILKLCVILGDSPWAENIS